MHDARFTIPKRFLHEEFAFDLDAAALPCNAKLPNYITPQEDALSVPWSGRVWLNPPFAANHLERWMKHAYTQTLSGAEVVVCLVPPRVDTAWFHEYALGHAAEIRFVRGRLFRFNRSMLVIFRQGHHKLTIGSYPAK